MSASLPAEMYQDLKDQLPTLEEAIKTGVSYGGELAHRFIIYDIAVNIVDCVVVFLITAVLVGYRRRIHNWVVVRMKEACDETGYIMLGGAYYILTALMVLWMVIGGTVAVETILKDLYIPEIRVAEVLSDLLSPSTNNE